MALNDCSLWPIDGKPTVTNLTAKYISLRNGWSWLI